MLDKRSKIIVLILIAIIGLLVFLEANEPEPVNWFPSYAKTAKIPLGAFVSYNILKEAYSQSRVTDVNQPPYEFLTYNDTIAGTYLFVNNTVAFDEVELEKILAWVEKGNTLFISAKEISKDLLDTLHIKMANNVALNQMSTKPLLELTNKHLQQQKPYQYDRDIRNPYFSKLDTIKAMALGVNSIYNDHPNMEAAEINYIKQPFGDGEILLHTFPEAFGNYFMLKDTNYTYTQNLLSYIDPSKELFWDNHYKSGKIFYTPLFLLFNSDSLKWAYYFLLIGTVLFVIFEGKRKQRSIPVIEPLKNQTIAFTQTISGMYFEKQKHKEIATKQQLLFLEYIRNVLRIPTDHVDEKTLVDIAARSNNTLEETKVLFNFFNDLTDKNNSTKEELIKLHTLITQFKKKA